MSMVEQPFKQPKLLSSQAHFARIPGADIPRSVFNRTSQYKTTFDAGYIVPFFVDEVLPGDSFKARVTSFARLATPKTPFMDNLYCDMFFFFVPYRLLWDNWEKFNGAQDNPGDSTDFQTPVVTVPGGGFAVGTLFDYFGLPTGVANIPTPVAFASRAYNLIYNEWFRDQNLIDSAVVDKDDGPDLDSDYVLRRRGKRHDYFTSALPWTQKGPAVQLPLGSSATVYGDGKSVNWWDGSGGMSGTFTDSSDGMMTGAPAAANLGTARTGGSPLTALVALGIPTKASGLQTGMYADLTDATASTINEIREAFQIQRLFERDARGGTRYVEILKSHFGVTSPDFRLQRPEYLGGGTTMINTAPVPQTSSTDGTSPQGNLAAMGTFSHRGVGFNHSFVEHGVVLGLVSVRADLTYQQGMNRMWRRRTRFDFYWPALAHLGEQAILNSEIYAQGTSADDDVFGYQERFAEYRYKPSLITGKFRSTYATPLDMWHLAQEFGSLPTLGQTFIEEDPPIDRVVAAPSEPDFMADFVVDLKCARPMPVYSVPGMVDHF